MGIDCFRMTAGRGVKADECLAMVASTFFGCFHQFARNAKAARFCMDEQLFEVGAMRLIWHLRQAKLYRADDLALMFGNQKRGLASIDFIGDTVPVGDEIMRFAWCHEADRCAAIHAIRNDFGKCRDGGSGFFEIENANHAYCFQRLLRRSSTIV